MWNFSVVEEIGRKFVYLADKPLFLGFLDRWNVMKPDSAGILHGDCDDFSTTSLWHLCDQSLWKFIWNVLILHRGRYHWMRTMDGELHIAASVGDLWFDNWTRRAVPKAEFFEYTGHKHLCVIPGFIAIFPLIFGWITA